MNTVKKIINKIDKSIRTAKFAFLSYLIKRDLEKILKNEENKSKPNPKMLNIRKAWAQKSLEIIGLKPEIIFDEDFRLEDNMVLICNHRSLLDILLIEYLVGKLSNKKSTFVAKKELKSNFLFGRLYELFGALFIDRKNPRDFIKTLRTIKNIKKEYPTGNMFVIYPEGTRLKNSGTKEIGEFKEGFLKIAHQTKTNILPVFIDGGVESYFEDYDKEKGPIKIKVGSIIQSENTTVDAIEIDYKKKFNLA